MLNTEITTSPWFYLLIAASLFLTLTYSWGRRKNKRIFLSAFNGLLAVVNSKDQQFTNIGGIAGYHANIVPKNNTLVRRVDATITLLPRQSLMFLPFSLLIRRFDRLFMIFYLAPDVTGSLAEGHLLEEKYSRFGSAKIDSEEQLQKETFQWGGKTFFMYYSEPWVKKELEKCRSLLGEPQGIRHIAMVPSQDRFWVFMVPRMDTVEGIMAELYPWMVNLLKKRQKAVK